MTVVYASPNTNSKGGGVTLDNGESVIEEQSDRDLHVAKGADLTLVAKPARGWELVQWTDFPGNTKNSSQVILAKRIHLQQIVDDQYVTVTFKPKTKAKFSIRVEGPNWDSPPYSHSGYVKWTVKHKSGTYDANWYGQCHIWDSSKFRECVTEYGIGTILELEIIPRGNGYAGTKTEIITIDDDVSREFVFANPEEKPKK